jgi:adenylate kinase family enzyme
MRRVVIVGRGGAGKSTLARTLGSVMDVAVIELDKHFWQPGLLPPSPDSWQEIQAHLAAESAWVMDGDFGPHDVLARRLGRADTVIVLDYGFAVCAWRAARRSREAKDFWLWVWHYRRRHLGAVLHAIRAYAPAAAVYRLRSPRATRRWLREV